MTASISGAAAQPPRASGAVHERTMTDFYAAFPYPWRPARFDVIKDPAFYAGFLCQDIGDYSRRSVPPDAQIWVPGCGTNQALITALRFPAATVVGTDISEVALDICQQNARLLGVSNLQLRGEAIGEVGYQAAFDYVLCTGVLHHNERVADGLRALARALRPNGILELMVYNTFHRREPAAFQAVIGLLLGDEADQGRRVRAGRRLAAALLGDTALTRALAQTTDDEDEEFADEWLNPLERSFTVAECWDLAASCGLQIEAPCISPVDKANESFDWELSFADDEIQSLYDGLADRDRWQLTNLLRLEQSPRLWFYLRHATAPRISELDRDEAFLNTVYTKAETSRQGYVRTETGEYRRLSTAGQVPAGAPAEEFRPLYDGLLLGRPPSDLLRLGDRASRAVARRARIQLATTQFPYLLAVI